MSRATGLWGEAQVATYLRKRGYRIVAHGYQCRFGEIDLIAARGKMLCFVEVKTRSDTAHGLPREAVTARKQEKLRMTAAFYLSVNELDAPVRFDVAEVYTDKAHNPASTRIEYLENAF
ncbi:MAG: YraN family protein [Clostridiales bacterium]|nr:YraN family protein [Candidatus Cacconaster stercorequi]